MTTDQTLIRLATAWLAGWDAALATKPESACPFAEIGADNSGRHLWQRGWAAGCRNQRADRLTMGRFVALSIGLNKEMPDE